MKKKIIFVTKALWIGGIETALVNLLNNFDYNTYDVTLLVLHAELDMKEQINSKCRLIIIDREQTISFNNAYKYKNLYHLTEEPDNPSRLHNMMMWAVPAIKWIENRLYVRYIRNLMKGESFDTAIIYSDVVAEAAICAVKADKYLMFYHHGAMRHAYHDKIAYKKCEKIIAVSENQANELRKFVPKYEKKIIAIHNLTDVDGICAKAAEPIVEDFDNTKFNIVSVGRVSHEKGMDIAVRACAKLVKDGFVNVCWWIVGDGPAMPEVKQAISESNMEEYVKLVGMKVNPYPYIKQADLYVQPSRFEGNPMTIIEALILGQPVVSTNNKGAQEIIEDGLTGILCQISVECITSEIENLMLDKEKLNNFKKNVAKIDFKNSNYQCIRSLENIF